MRRLLLLPVLFLGFASAVAIGSTDAKTARAARASAAGTIKSLSPSAITVHSVFDVTCTLRRHSPSLDGYTVGDQVKIACANGYLLRIAHVETTTPPSTGPLAPTGDTPAAGTTTSGGRGTITALTASSITVTGDRSLTCAITGNSPGTGDFHLGDAVKIGCVNGTLYYIVKDAPTTTTTTTTSTTAGGSGTISALTPTSITVAGEHSLTCTIGPHSPGTGDFHVGDAVRIGCLNGALYYIVSASPLPSTTTTTTTTTTTSTTSTTNAYGIGTITFLSSTTITVTGDRSLSCEITSSSPPLGDYHVGDHVKMGCQNQVLYGIVKDDTSTTTSTTTTGTTTPTVNTYGIGAITAFSVTSITVTGDRNATCSIAPGGPLPSDYGLGVGDHITPARTAS